MRLTATDFYTYHRPSKCELRVHLRHRGEKEAPDSPYAEVLKDLGLRHERAHLATLPSYADLSSGAREERERRTREEVEKGSPVIYQPALRVHVTLSGVECEIVGDPDFLLRDNDNYAIRDSKISRRINENDHPQILRQLEIYGWLYEQTFGCPPSALQVHSGTNAIIELAYDGGVTALALLEEILALKTAGEEPYSPVGWSKCVGCGFQPRCWEKAEQSRDVALVAGVDQGLAVQLRQDQVHTVEALVADFDEVRLAELRRPWGQVTQRVGRKAEFILRMARALVSGEEALRQQPAIPERPNYVMFDLEGLPPQLDELDKIYLWGLQVFGEEPSDYLSATAGFGADGDRQGWEDFLGKAQTIFEHYGDLPFVHWHHYERVRLDVYVQRYGDPNGIAARVRKNLLDLLRITQDAITLPLPSYSLKVVERYVGFKRTQDEYGGDWAMAQYIKATETDDEKLRAEVLDQLYRYNREDLEATWAVLEWLKGKTQE
jgi:predicted RecB family nuclease